MRELVCAILAGFAVPAFAGVDYGADGNITNVLGFTIMPMGAGGTCDPGDMPLTRNSPCLNTGTNQSWMADATELDVRRRCPPVAAPTHAALLVAAPAVGAASPSSRVAWLRPAVSALTPLRRPLYL